MAALVRDPMVSLYSQHFDATVSFYERLGLSRGFRYPFEGDPHHIELHLGHFELAVVDVAKAAAEHGLDIEPDGHAAELVFWTDDVDALFNQLTTEGAPAMAPPRDFLDLRTAWVRDPDGNPVHICARLA